MRRVFLSFSSADRIVVRPLMAMLRDQGLAVWDYSAFREEIPVGSPISEILKAEIEACDVFVPLLTCSSTSMDECGRYTRLEHGHAMSIGKPIMPILWNDRAPKPAEWKGDSFYAPMSCLRYAEFSGTKEEDLQAAVEPLCRDMKIAYQPRMPDDPKLPVLRKFRDEADALLQTNAIHADLRGILGRFSRAYREERWSDAESLVGFFVSSIEYHKIAKEPLYYSMVVQGVLALHHGDSGKARTCFEKAKSSNPLDGNAHGGLGIVCMRTGAFKDAVQHFRKVLELPTNDLFNDQCNLAVAQLSADGSISKEMRDRIIAADSATLMDRDRIALAILQGHLFRIAGHPRECLRVLLPGLTESDTQYIAFLETSLAMESLQDASGIRGVVDHAKKRGFAPELVARLYNHLANVLIGTGQTMDSLALRREILCRPPYRDRRELVKLARLCDALGKTTERDSAAREVLDPKGFPPPRTPDEFFQCGYAQFLLGRLELAEYDRIRSGSTEVYEASTRT